MDSSAESTADSLLDDDVGSLRAAHLLVVIVSEVDLFSIDSLIFFAPNLSKVGRRMSLVSF